MAVTFNPTGSGTPNIDLDYLQNVSFANMMGGIKFNTNIQGCALINASFFASLKLELQNMNSCAEVQQLVNKAMATVNAEVQVIEKQLTQFEPMLDLLKLPTNPLTWIIKFIKTVLLPFAAPYATYVTQLEQIINEVAIVAAAAESAARLIEGGCDINIPFQLPGCLGLLAPGPSGNPKGVPHTPTANVQTPVNLNVTDVTPTGALLNFTDPNVQSTAGNNVISVNPKTKTIMVTKKD